MSEILIILVVVLLLFGPNKLPEFARSLGRAVGTFRRTLDELKFDIPNEKFDILADTHTKKEVDQNTQTTKPTE